MNMQNTSFLITSLRNDLEYIYLEELHGLMGLIINLLYLKTLSNSTHKVVGRDRDEMIRLRLPTVTN